MLRALGELFRCMGVEVDPHCGNVVVGRRFSTLPAASCRESAGRKACYRDEMMRTVESLSPQNLLFTTTHTEHISGLQRYRHHLGI